MAKWNRKLVGSFVKSKDPKKPPYIKIKENVTLSEGTFLNVESKKFRLQSLEERKDKMKEELYNKIRAQIDDTPEWALGDVVLLTKEED